MCNPLIQWTRAVAATHVGDLGVGALHVVGVLGARLTGRAQFLVHTGLLLGTPHTAVLLVSVLAQAAVLPAHWAIVQRHCGDIGTFGHKRFTPCQLISCFWVDRLKNTWATEGSVHCFSVVVFFSTLADAWSAVAFYSIFYRHVYFLKPEQKDFCFQPVYSGTFPTLAPM